MTVTLRTSDGFADRLLADARDGLAQYRAICGELGDVLDIGAHYGAFALEAREAGASSVLAVEASLANYTSLLENIMAVDGYSWRVSPIHAAVLESDLRTVPLRRAAGGNSGQYSVVFHEGHPLSDAAVPVLTFSTVLEKRFRWSYVKIDIEGGEWSLLQQREKAVEILMAHTRFLDLEVHPLDAPEYYPATPREQYAYVDEVGEWFRTAGHGVTWTAQHPTRLFVAAK